ncbi:MAG TPA: hypothetical protein VF499_11400, partial [Afipia sp.]
MATTLANKMSKWAERLPPTADNWKSDFQISRIVFTFRTKARAPDCSAVDAIKKIPCLPSILLLHAESERRARDGDEHGGTSAAKG